MKKLKITNQEACKACLECVRACSMAFYKEFDPGKSCIKIVEGKTKNSVKTKTCIQCGKCAKACTHDAIKQNAKGVYMIDKKLCVGCGDCVEACPMGVMVLENNLTSKCIACGICAKACPMDILEIEEK